MRDREREREIIRNNGGRGPKYKFRRKVQKVTAEISICKTELQSLHETVDSFLLKRKCIMKAG